MSKKLLTAVLFALSTSAVIADEAYNALDADKSGAISESEAAALPGLKDKWTALDADANGELSVEEFAKFETSEIEAPAMDAPVIDATTDATATDAPAAQ